MLCNVITSVCILQVGSIASGSSSSANEIMTEGSSAAISQVWNYFFVLYGYGYGYSYSYCNGYLCFCGL